VSLETLTLKSIRARSVVLKLKRPVVARIATLPERPLILIDLHPEEGVIGRSYLEPYIRKLIGYLIPALYDLGEMFKGRRLASIEFSKADRKSLHFVGYEGMSMIAVAGLDMAAGTHWRGRLVCQSVRCWDAASALCRRATAMASG